MPKNIPYMINAFKFIQYLAQTQYRIYYTVLNYFDRGEHPPQYKPLSNYLMILFLAIGILYSFFSLKIPILSRILIIIYITYTILSVFQTKLFGLDKILDDHVRKFLPEALVEPLDPGALGLLLISFISTFIIFLGVRVLKFISFLGILIVTYLTYKKHLAYGNVVIEPILELFGILIVSYIVFRFCMLIVSIVITTVISFIGSTILLAYILPFFDPSRKYYKFLDQVSKCQTLYNLNFSENLRNIIIVFIATAACTTFQMLILK